MSYSPLLSLVIQPKVIESAIAANHERSSSSFSQLSTDVEDYELAAEYFNLCRRNGIQGSNTDFLICATASRRNYEIFTTDKDFVGFKEYLPIVLNLLS